MRKSLIFFLILGCAVGLSAAPEKSKKAIIPADVPKQFSSQESIWLKGALTEEVLIRRLKAIAADFSRGKNGRMLTVPECRNRTRELQRYAKYYFLEVDSGISRAWILHLVKYTEALTKAQEKIHFFVMNKRTNSPEYRQWYDYYNKIATDMRKRIAKPVKVTDRKRLANLAKIKKAVIARELAKDQADKEKAPKLDEKNLK